MSYQLAVRSQFSAAHAIVGHGGKCEKLHGHNFDVELTVRGDTPDPATGMLVDFSILKKALAEVLDTLDHAILNDIPAFTATSPSSENLARYIGQELESRLECPRARLYSVSISEKSTQTATWFA